MCEEQKIETGVKNQVYLQVETQCWKSKKNRDSWKEFIKIGYRKISA